MPAHPIPAGTPRQETLPLVVQGLGKSYGDRVIVRDLSFDVKPGEVLALWGDNGAGKTTILRSLLGLIHHEGEVWIGGWSRTKNRREAQGSFGHVSQEPAFHGDLSVAQTMTFYGHLRGADDEAQERALADVGLVGVEGRRVKALSGGMRRKLAVAVALLGGARVLLLDEPTSNLDQRSRREVILLLRRLKETGIAMVLATHQPDEIAALADRVLQITVGEPAVESDLAAFHEHVHLSIPGQQRDQAVRALLDAGIPLEQVDFGGGLGSADGLGPAGGRQ